MNQAGDAIVNSTGKRWDFLGGVMKELGLKTFVEVGCKEGRVTGHILKTLPEARVVAIDPWCVKPLPDNGDPKRETYEKWDFEKIEAEFWENVGENKDRCQQLRTRSLDAVGSFADGSQDLIFIDALHDQEAVKDDIDAWWPKVRVGGVLAGHDFNHKWPGVERAVADAFDLMTVGIGIDSVWFVVKNG